MLSVTTKMLLLQLRGMSRHSGSGVREEKWRNKKPEKINCTGCWLDIIPVMPRKTINSTI